MNTTLIDVPAGLNGVVAAIDNPGGARVVNLGNSGTVTLEHFIDVIEDSLGMKATRNYMDIQPGDVVRTWADVSRAEKYYGWRPTTPIEVGIPRFIEWYRGYYSV